MLLRHDYGRPKLLVWVATTRFPSVCTVSGGLFSEAWLALTKFGYLTKDKRISSLFHAASIFVRP